MSWTDIRQTSPNRRYPHPHIGVKLHEMLGNLDVSNQFGDEYLTGQNAFPYNNNFC